jgi:hypothetical protein
LADSGTDGALATGTTDGIEAGYELLDEVLEATTQ